MSAHTPGPWSGKTVIAMTVALEECGVSLGFGSNRTEEAVANARLIAAAPELLEALKLCASVCAGETSDKNGLISALEAARSAMKKATGAA